MFLVLFVHLYIYYVNADCFKIMICFKEIPEFYKTCRDSGLRVMMSYNSRSKSYDNELSCCRYYLKFNGHECIQPGTIEGASAINNKLDLYQSNISMLCYFLFIVFRKFKVFLHNLTKFQIIENQLT